MDVKHLWLVVVFSVYAGTLAAQEQTTPYEEVRPLVRIDSFVVDGVAIPINETPTLDQADGTNDSQGYGWAKALSNSFYQVILWFTTPFCEILNNFINWLGVPSEPVVFNFATGDMAFYFGIADAWLPIHEIINSSMLALVVTVVWIPIRFALKYMVPFIG